MDWRSATFFLIREENVSFPLERQLASFRDYVATYQASGLNTITLVWMNPVDAQTGQILEGFSDPPWPLVRESLDTVEAFTAAARDMGMNVVWKPHFVVDANHPDNVNQISAPNIDVANFLAEVRAFWREAAPRSEAAGADMVILGTEHADYGAGVHEAAWRAIIADVREVYSGILTYNANSILGRDYIAGADDVGFWDALDLIALSMYAPLARDATTTYENAYRTLFDNPANVADPGPGVNIPTILADLAARFGKPVYFSEAGAASHVDALLVPPAPGFVSAQSYEAQRILYQVHLDVFGNYDWFSGINWWGEHNEFSPGPSSADWPGYFSDFLKRGYDFLGKPSGEAVAAAWRDGVPPPPIDYLGTQNADRAIGGRGDDVFVGRGGNDTLIGAAGIDRARYEGVAADYVVTGDLRAASVRDARPGRDGTDALAAIERIVFADRTLALDVAGAPGEMYRLYQAAFARRPDEAGLGFWITEFEAGRVDLRGAAAAFVASREFTQTYGLASEIGDRAYVDLLYGNVLGRPADEAGALFWTQRMASGTSREEVLGLFAQSPENVALVAPAVADGIWYV
ncbi:DUF4214 domain-containing protein [Salinarimonas ramus]|uniref:DUF4214 domain-containing protein n=1 Tax=Salinarimonas ramus TaxID=690164 RepID=UPI001664B447|nr:DUF4214 domain-containing protein [Salinarimonas ramus]